MNRKSDSARIGNSVLAARLRHLEKMKTLLVGDNISNPNWGGRAVSITLRQILAGLFPISDAITGDAFLPDVAGFGYVDTLLPARYDWLYLKLRQKQSRSRLCRFYVAVEELAGAKDFVAEEPPETVRNILRYKSRHSKIRQIYEQVAGADLVLINGEGDMVLSTPPRREALFLMGVAELALQLKKKVAFVNSMISDCPMTGQNVKTLNFLRNILSRCAAVTVRDHESLEYLSRQMPEVECAMVPDSVFAWFKAIGESEATIPANGDFIIPFPENTEHLGKLNFERPYICVGGSALAEQDTEKSIKHFSRLVFRLQQLNYPVYLTENCAGDAFLRRVAAATGAGLIPVNTSVYMGAAILANARLFVSGRYHPSIFASLGGTPCIFIESSAHKMESLQRVLEYEQIRQFSLFCSEAEMDEMIERAKNYLRAGDVLRTKIRAIAHRRYEEVCGLAELLCEKLQPEESNVAIAGRTTGEVEAAELTSKAE